MVQKRDFPLYPPPSRVVFQLPSLFPRVCTFGWAYTDVTTKIFRMIDNQIDLIHDTRQLCTRSRTDRMKAMSRGISGVKQVIKCLNTSNRGRVC